MDVNILLSKCDFFCCFLIFFFILGIFNSNRSLNEQSETHSSLITVRGGGGAEQAVEGCDSRVTQRR